MITGVCRGLVSRNEVCVVLGAILGNEVCVDNVPMQRFTALSLNDLEIQVRDIK